VVASPSTLAGLGDIGTGLETLARDIEALNILTNALVVLFFKIQSFEKMRWSPCFTCAVHMLYVLFPCQFIHSHIGKHDVEGGGN
jgi:hypothetical protein